MEEVVKNTHAFVDVLCTARGEGVQGWDEDSFHRALKWAQYFEQVHNKLKSKPGLANKLDKYIDNFNKTASVYLGHLNLSFSQLANSKCILRNCLLQNPYITDSQFRHVLKLYGLTIGSENGRTHLETFEKDVVPLMKHKGTLKILSQMREKLTKDSIQFYDKTIAENQELSTNTRAGSNFTTLDTCTIQSISRESTGELLFKYVQHVLDFSESKDKHCIADKLDVISSQKHGIDTITSCLLYLPDDCKSLTEAKTTQRIILNWLLDSLKGKKNYSFWHLPISYLSKISCKYDDILKLYLERLMEWGNKMMPLLAYELTDQERMSLACDQVYIWRCSDGISFSGESGTCTFEDFCQHFVYLLSGLVHVQELCYNTLKSNITNYYREMTPEKEIAKKLGINFWQDVCDSLAILDIFY